MLPSPDQNLKIGSVGRFFFFFFLRTVRELSFPIFFLKFLNGENSGGMQSKRIYKCFFKPLNTNFSKFFAQIWHKKNQPRPCFFAFYGRSGEGNITIFWGGLMILLRMDIPQLCLCTTWLCRPTGYNNHISIPHIKAVPEWLSCAEL